MKPARKGLLLLLLHALCHAEHAMATRCSPHVKRQGRVRCCSAMCRHVVIEIDNATQPW
jgi:hypothetical protein